MASRRKLEEEILYYSRRVHERGWVANHDGNLTVRLPDGERFLATPTAESKGAIQREWLIVVDDRGQVVGGRRKVFSEIALHLYVYRQRPDARAVLHAHPPTATGLGVAGVPVETRMLAESVVSLGHVPRVPYARPKTPAFTANLGPHLPDADVLLLENHGVIALGPDLETYYLRLELVEHLARIQSAAMQAGGVRTLPEADVEALLEARTKAGLGRAAREAKGEGRSEVQAVVRSEVARAFGR